MANVNVADDIISALRVSEKIDVSSLKNNLSMLDDLNLQKLAKDDKFIKLLKQKLPDNFDDIKSIFNKKNIPLKTSSSKFIDFIKKNYKAVTGGILATGATGGITALVLKNKQDASNNYNEINEINEQGGFKIIKMNYNQLLGYLTIYYEPVKQICENDIIELINIDSIPKIDGKYNVTSVNKDNSIVISLNEIIILNNNKSGFIKLNTTEECQYNIIANKQSSGVGSFVGNILSGITNTLSTVGSSGFNTFFGGLSTTSIVIFFIIILVLVFKK